LKKIFSIVIVYVIMQNVIGQTKDTASSILKTYKIKATDFNVDQLGNIYAITPTMQLKKFNANGDSLAVFNLSKRFGKLGLIDVSNPLKAILFYPNFSTILLVDRLLSVTNNIDLRKQNSYQVKTVCQSYDSHIWFYDEQDAKIKKVNEKGAIIQKSIDLRSQFKETITPHKMFETSGLLYLLDTINGVFVFDTYGAFKKQIPLQNCSSFFVVNSKIYGLKKDSLYKYNLIDQKIEIQKLPIAKNYKKLIVVANKMYALTNDAIIMYKNEE
jgi:hypothetical protein